MHISKDLYTVFVKETLTNRCSTHMEHTQMEYPFTYILGCAVHHNRQDIHNLNFPFDPAQNGSGVLRT